MSTASTTLVLIAPPQTGLLEGFAASLVPLAAYVQRATPEVEVQVLDLGLKSPEDLQPALTPVLEASRHRLFVGITTTTPTYQSALLCARAAKDIRPDAVVVLGGHHATAEDATILRYHRRVAVDCVVRGEGERALAALIRKWPYLDDVPNLTFWSNDQAVRTPTAPFLGQEDLDSLPPIYDPRCTDAAPGKFDHLTYVSARGCPLACAFCAVANQKIRAKSTVAVVRDLRLIMASTTARQFAIEDNFFAHSPRRTLELCAALQQLRQEEPFTFDCQTRVESVCRPDVLHAMADAGCEAVYLGVEALAPRQLVYLGKTASPDRYLRRLEEEAVPGVLDSGIACYINLQLGVPGETEPDRNEALGMLRRLGDLARSRQQQITLFPQLHVVYPGTKHHAQAVSEQRWGPESSDTFEAFTRWEANQEPVVRWLGEHFAHGTGGLPEGILDAAMLGRGEFSVDASAVLRIVKQLEQIDSVPGVRRFRYTPYLANVPPAAREETTRSS